MRSLFSILFFFAFPLALVAQVENDMDTLLQQAEAAVYSDPSKALPIGEYILKNSTEASELLEATYLLARVHYIQGDINKALQVALDFESASEDLTKDTKLKLSVFIAMLLSELDLEDLSLHYFNRALQLDDQDTPTNRWVKAKLQQRNGSSKAKDRDTLGAIAMLGKAKEVLDPLYTSAFENQLNNVNIALSSLHTNNFEPTKAKQYIEAAYQQSKTEKPGNYLELAALQQFGMYYFENKEYQTSIDTLTAALAIAVEFENIPIQVTLYEKIASNHLALDDLENFKIVNQEASQLNNSISAVENDAINTAFNYINKKQERDYSEAERQHYNFTLLLTALILIGLLVWIILRVRYNARIKQYEGFINYFEKRKVQEIKKEAPPTKLVAKSLNIPKEKEKVLIQKLKKFENSTHFIHQDMSLAQLASKFDTNTKYLSEIINSYKDKNFNTYINELRIDYIIDKLKNEPKYLNYKISYLAEESGFSSHSSFATVFKSITGISPTVFINLLRTKNENAAA